MKSLIQKICYSRVMPRWIIRIFDEFLLLPAMWFPLPAGRKFFNRLRGVTIGRGGWIGQGTLLGNHPFLLTIGDNVILAAGVKLLTHDTSFTVVGGHDLAGEIKIGKNIQIGENAVILPGVEIGDNCIIGAGAVATKDIPSGNVAVGVPAKIICSTVEAMAKLDERLKGGKYFSTWKNPDRAKINSPQLKICILSNKKHIYSNYLIQRLLESFSSDEFTVIESTLLLGGMTKPRALFKYLKVSGFHYTVSQIFKNLYFNYLGFFFGLLHFNFSRKYFPYKFLKFQNLKTVVACSAVNEPAFVEWIKEEVKPDLILSLYFNQILKKDILDIPKLGSFNLHPALLPKYRGISPTFWALAKGEGICGITLHKISQKIDEGDIVSQKEVDSSEYDTEHSLYEKCGQAGFNLIFDLIHNLKKGISPELKTMNLSGGSYFSIPTKQAMRDFSKNKRKLWSMGEFFKKYE